MSWTNRPNVNQRASESNARHSNPKDNIDHPHGTRTNYDHVATSFTEGLETFSEIFTTSVESAIFSILPAVIEKAIDAKLHGEISLLRKEIQELRNTLPRKIQETIHETLSVKEVDYVNKPATESSPNVNRHRIDDEKQERIERELSSLLNILKEIGRPVKADELRSLLPEIKWSSNSSIKLSNLMIKSNGQIERVGRGFYQYVNSAE